MFAGPVVASAAAAAPAVELVYAAPNEGGSSGGHAALRLGDRIYHYQARPDGQLELRRDSWLSFVAHYNLLGNRSLERARLALAPASVAELAAQLDRRWLVEGRHRAAAQALSFERRVLEARARGAGRVQVEAAGLFARDSEPDPLGQRLLARVEAVLGMRALARQRAEVAATPLPPSAALPPLSLETQQLPALPVLAGEGWRERLQLLAALDAIERARPLAPGLLLDPLGWPLSPPERRWLRARARQLERRAVGLLRSRRPDRGRALLVAVARHRAVEASLTAGRWLTLDPFPAAPLAAGADGPSMGREALQALRADLRAAHARLRLRVSRAREVDFAATSALENLAARHHEVARSLDEGTPLRSGPARLVPGRSAPLSIDALGLAAPAPGRVRLARQSERRYARAVAELYDYDLLLRNCATELARALGLEADARAAVPRWLLAQAVRELPVAERVRVPGYRLRRLAQLRAGGSPLGIALRESHVFGSTLYPGSASDGAFLFFSDDVLLRRPLYGAVNLGYAALYSGAGLLSAPVDRGRRLSRGARGMLWSLPELAFLSLRKGSYEYLPEVAELGRAAGP